MFNLFNIIPIIVIIIFITTFIVIVATIIKETKMQGKIWKTAMDRLNEDPYERAEKMAIINAKAKAEYDKEVNPEMKALKCPNCGGSVKENQEKCEYCNAYLTKGAK